MAVIDKVRDVGEREEGLMPAALQLALGICRRASVSRLGYSAGDHAPTFWAFIDTDGLKEETEETEEIFRIAQNIRRQYPDVVPIHLHVMPTKQVIEAALPPYTLLYSRA